jgi:hypothetical protein
MRADPNPENAVVDIDAYCPKILTDPSTPIAPHALQP